MGEGHVYLINRYNKNFGLSKLTTTNSFDLENVNKTKH